MNEANGLFHNALWRIVVHNRLVGWPSRHERSWLAKKNLV